MIGELHHLQDQIALDWPSLPRCLASSFSRVIPKHEYSGAPELEVTVRFVAPGEHPRESRFAVLSTANTAAILNMIQAELVQLEATARPPR